MMANKSQSLFFNINIKSIKKAIIPTKISRKKIKIKINEEEEKSPLTEKINK